MTRSLLNSRKSLVYIKFRPADRDRSLCESAAQPGEPAALHALVRRRTGPLAPSKARQCWFCGDQRSKAPHENADKGGTASIDLLARPNAAGNAARGRAAAR